MGLQHSSNFLVDDAVLEFFIIILIIIWGLFVLRLI